MATCKDCLHCKACTEMLKALGYTVDGDGKDADKRCPEFQNAADYAAVVRCHNCAHAVPLDRNCELNTCVYMHCNISRGETVKNVWHKYKKYYKDYSIVEHDGFCDEGERRTNV